MSSVELVGDYGDKGRGFEELFVLAVFHAMAVKYRLHVRLWGCVGKELRHVDVMPCACRYGGKGRFRCQHALKPKVDKPSLIPKNHQCCVKGYLLKHARNPTAHSNPN